VRRSFERKDDGDGGTEGGSLVDGLMWVEEREEEPCWWKKRSKVERRWYIGGKSWRKRLTLKAGRGSVDHLSRQRTKEDERREEEMPERRLNASRLLIDLGTPSSSLERRTSQPLGTLPNPISPSSFHPFPFQEALRTRANVELE